MSAGPGAEEAVVGGGAMGFPADAGSQGLALREGVLGARGADESPDSDDPRLPPLRLGVSYADSGAALASPGSTSSSSDAFLSTSSTPSGTRDTQISFRSHQCAEPSLPRRARAETGDTLML
jgi:hypothetical protein